MLLRRKGFRKNLNCQVAKEPGKVTIIKKQYTLTPKKGTYVAAEKALIAKIVKQIKSVYFRLIWRELQ
jgi:hypothetical protein